MFGSGEAVNNGKLNIVCTTYPQYNWIQNIIGEDSEKFNLTLLIDGGVDLHSYQPLLRIWLKYRQRICLCMSALIRCVGAGCSKRNS